MIAAHRMRGGAVFDITLNAIQEAFAAKLAARQQQKEDVEMAEKQRATLMTDHAAATAEALEKVIAMLKAGQSPEDLGPMVILIGRMMARRT
jgi:hypothetical protein